MRKPDWEIAFKICSATLVIHDTFVKNGNENDHGKQLARLLEEKKRATTLYAKKNGKARKRRKTKDEEMKSECRAP